MVFKKILAFFKSPYIHLGKIFFICIFGATLTTLYPFHDLTIGYIFRWKIGLIWGIGFIMTAICVVIVSLTWYWLHMPNYDSATSIWSMTQYILFGGVLPMILILSEIALVQGVDLLFEHAMQYHLWFYAALLFVLNMYYRSVGFRTSVQNLKLDLTKLQLDNQEQQSNLQIKEAQVEELNTLLREKEKMLELLQNENMELIRKSADWEKLYIVKIGSNRKAILKSEIGGFMINEETRIKGAKPIIQLYLLSGESHIDDNESLKGIHLLIPEFRLVTRQLLISPNSITGYTERKGEVALHVKFLDKPYILKAYSWERNKDWIKEIVDR